MQVIGGVALPNEIHNGPVWRNRWALKKRCCWKHGTPSLEKTSLPTNFGSGLVVCLLPCACWHLSQTRFRYWRWAGKWEASRPNTAKGWLILLFPSHANYWYLAERTDKGNEMLGWSEITQDLLAECCSIARKTFTITVLCLKKAILIPCLYDRQSCSRAPDENKLLGYADVIYTSYQKPIIPRKAWYYVKRIHINLS